MPDSTTSTGTAQKPPEFQTEQVALVESNMYLVVQRINASCRCVGVWCQRSEIWQGILGA